MASSHIVIDHNDIRNFAERTNGNGGPGMLRFDHGRDNEGLEQISWDRFFEIFEEQQLALMLDKSGDNPSFNKFVSRNQG